MRIATYTKNKSELIIYFTWMENIQYDGNYSNEKLWKSYKILVMYYTEKIQFKHDFISEPKCCSINPSHMK